MARKDDLICPQCDSYLGDSNGLECCPVCGKNLTGKEDSD